MDGQDVRPAEQFVFGHVGCPGLFGGLRGQVRAPRDDVHTERLAYPRHSSADPAQPQHAQHRSAQLPADGCLPSTAAHREALIDDPAGGGEDQRPGQFDRRLHVTAGRADIDAVFLSGRDVDRCVERAGGGDHLQPWQTLDHGTRQRCALAHHAHHVERRQPVDDGVLIGQVVGENGDLGAADHIRPVGGAQCDVLVIVENRDPHCANLAYLV
jgi:hypothetical protein